MAKEATLAQISDSIVRLLGDYKEDRDTVGEAIVQLHERASQLRYKEPELAIEYCDMALKLTRSPQTSPNLDSTLGEAVTLMCLGATYTPQDRLEQAADCFRESAMLFRSVAKRVGESIAWFALAQVREQVNTVVEWSEVLGAYQLALSALKAPTGLSILPTGNVEQLKRDIQQALEGAIKQFEQQKLAHPSQPKSPFTATESRVLQIPVVARIAAGEPILAYREDDESLTVGKEIAREADVALRVRGDSMVGAGILDGDYVLIRKQPVAHNQDIAAVLIKDFDAEATLKRLFRYSDHILLRAENPAVKSIVVAADQSSEKKLGLKYDPNEFDLRFGSEVLVRGKAVAVIRRL